jgi:hypothetical protein
MFPLRGGEGLFDPLGSRSPVFREAYLADLLAGQSRFDEQGKIERHARPLAYAALDLHASPVRLDDGLGDGEP